MVYVSWVHKCVRVKTRAQYQMSPSVALHVLAPTSFLSQGLSLNLEVTEFSETGHHVWGTLLFSPAQCLAFYVGAQIWTWVSKLTQQVLYPLSHLLSPRTEDILAQKPDLLETSLSWPVTTKLENLPEADTRVR